jgi:L-alanine-DL-glutamate epimerase-like enolase superfamily enzyme
MPEPVAVIVADAPSRHPTVSCYGAGGMNSQAIAAIENASLDVKAKALGVPVYALFGGAMRDRLDKR